MQLYEHQKRFDTKNPDRALLAWETGTGKTVSACTGNAFNVDVIAHILSFIK